MSSTISSILNSSSTSTISSTVTSTLEATAESILNDKLALHFSWYDYALFAGMLAMSTGIGIYYGFFSKKQSTSKEYLLGGRELKVLPVGISLIASHISGISLMAVPADVYMFGASYGLCLISVTVMGLVTSIVFLPVFYNLKVTSTYEYLERRFDERCRKCASFLFALSVLAHSPMVVYIPALAFAGASGIGIKVTCPIICTVCIFYTTFGGLKALVKNDSIQFTTTIASMILLIILGIYSLGISNFWNASMDTGRLDIFDFDPSPLRRETFWSLAIGFSIHLVANSSVNQGCTQKFMAVNTLKKSIMTVFLFCFGMGITKLICVTIGLIMAAKYATCDPIMTNQIEKKDQLVLYYVMDIAKNIPGLAGLFTAGIFSAGLSGMSGNLNSIAATIYEDFLKKWLEKRHDNHTAGYTLKIIVVLVGIIVTGLAFLVPYLGGVFGLSIAMGSIAHGPMLGMFTLGVLFPRANAKGAFFGALTAMATMATIICGSRYYTAQGLLKYDKKPMSVDGCDFPFNVTGNIANPTNPLLTEEPYIPALFKLSFYWYSMTGAIICILVGICVSYMTKKDGTPVDRELISPVARFLLPKEPPKTNGFAAEYHSVPKAMEMVDVEKFTDGEMQIEDEKKDGYSTENGKLV